ncbi:MAG: hypothetical protein AAGA68_24460 [Pseudomonadota bacterium]
MLAVAVPALFGDISPTTVEVIALGGVYSSMTSEIERSIGK